MTQKAKLPSRIVRTVDIDRVRLVEVNAKARISSAANLGEAEFAFGVGARIAKHSKEEGTFVVVATIDARVLSESPEQLNPAVSIKTSYELTYALPKGFNVSRRELNAFAKTNGIFNAWPYWREHIQALFARMDLPQPTLPAYLIDSGPARRPRPSEQVAQRGGAHSRESAKAVRG
jgi:hypothetical protein